MDSPKKKSLLLFYLVIGGVIALVFLGAVKINLSISVAQARAQQINCRSDMRSILHGCMLQANKTDKLMPRTLTELSNCISSPKILFCRGDVAVLKEREHVTTWSEFEERRCSYEILHPGIAAESDTNLFLRCKYHDQYIYVDGTMANREGTWNVRNPLPREPLPPKPAPDAKPGGKK